MKAKSALLGVLTLAVCLAVHAQAQSCLTNGLVAYYPFHGDANDASGNGNNGAVYGAQLTADRFGIASTAFSFDGNSEYISLPISSFLNNAQTATISLWVKDNSSNQTGAFLGDWAEATGGIYLNDYTGSNAAIAILPNGSITTSTQSLVGNWHQVVVVFDGTQTGNNNRLQFYVDGISNVLSFAYAIPTSLGGGSSSVLIGARQVNGIPGDFFSGQVSDIRIYNRALLASEIRQLYTNESTPPRCLLTNGLAAYYPFSANANDASGNGNNGTVLGATLTQDLFGIPNSAYAFDGISDLIIVPDFPQADANVHTISAWIKANSWTNFDASTPYVDILGKDGGVSGPRQWVCQGKQNGQIRWAVFTSTGEYDLDSAAMLQPNQWYQIVTVWDGTNESGFINGVFDSSISAPGSLIQGNAPVRIGGNPDDFQQFLDGSMANVRIYNRTLSSNEIAELYAIESTEPVPTITIQPVSTTNNIGDEVSFNVFLTNTVPLTYQWYFDSDPLANATNSSLNITNVQEVNVGNYYVVVSDFSGSVTSSAATLNIPGVPNWINNGLVAYYPFSGNANDASGNGNNGIVAGALLTNGLLNQASHAYYFNGTNASIGIPPFFDAGQPNYTLSFWFNIGNTSQIDQTFISSCPNPTLQIEYNQTINNAEGYVSYSIGSGSGWIQTQIHGTNNNYQANTWYQVALVKQGSQFSLYIDGTSSESSSANVPDTGPIGFEMGDVCGGDTTMLNPGMGTGDLLGNLEDVRFYDLALSSNEVQQLYAYETGTNPPTILVQPQPITVNAGENASFSVAAYGSPPLNYQWQFNATNISGATSSSLSISNVAQSNLGNYSAVITNAFGSISSSNAMLSMYPYIRTPFSGVITDWGQNATLSVQAWGTGPLSYQWFDNGIPIQNATNQTLTLDSIQFTNAGLYTVVVSSPLGSATNAPEQVVVNPAGVSLGLYPGVTVTGTVGYTYDIQVTSDLSNTNSWVTVATLTLEQPAQLWIDTTDNTTLHTNAARFYRVIPGQ